MTENQLKNILEIEDWSQVDSPDRFMALMGCFYELAPGVRKKILPKIIDINGLAEQFKDYCAFSIMEYEPSIMLVLSKQIDDLKKAVGESNKIRGPEKREKIAYLYTVFSEWFGGYSDVQCSVGEIDFNCSVYEALELARENEEAPEYEKSKLNMMLMTEERIKLHELSNVNILEKLDMNLEEFAEMLESELGDMGFEPEDEEPPKNYIM